MEFEEYLAEQGRALIRLAFVLTAADAHRAEDLTQGVLTDVYVRWDKVSAAGNPHAYVRRMMVNAHLDWHRRCSSTERPTSSEIISQSLPQWHRNDPADEVGSREQFRTLVADLPPRARTVLVLCYFADLDDAAISEAMGISAGTVRSLRSRALTTLRRVSNTRRSHDQPC